MFNYRWTLKDAVFTKDKGKVFSCFSCGGGSTMGYKLAGFDVIGCNEIDPKMMQAYIANHNPKYSYLESICDFKNRTDLPEELYNLDILDGSPPCSSFSMAGNREKDWGCEKTFREGQEKQVLDTLFFDFIDVAKKLQPKVVIAENVKGLLLGKAQEYVYEINQAFNKAGYYIQHFLLDSSKMGVPQKRERVFFVGLRKDIAAPFLQQADLFSVAPELKLEFNEKEIPFKEISQTDSNLLDEKYFDLYDKIKEGQSVGDYKGWGFGDQKVTWEKPLPTIIANQRKSSFGAGLIHPKQKRKLNDIEFLFGSTFPLDYNFINSKNENFTGYLVGMSVPPVMMANIATEIYKQWLTKI